jgi:hypothetical protein
LTKVGDLEGSLEGRAIAYVVVVPKDVARVYIPVTAVLFKLCIFVPMEIMATPQNVFAMLVMNFYGTGCALFHAIRK